MVSRYLLDFYSIHPHNPHHLLYGTLTQPHPSIPPPSCSASGLITPLLPLRSVSYSPPRCPDSSRSAIKFHPYRNAQSWCLSWPPSPCAAISEVSFFFLLVDQRRLDSLRRASGLVRLQLHLDLPPWFLTRGRTDLPGVLCSVSFKLTQMSRKF
jgi:hypothetical protein